MAIEKQSEGNLNSISERLSSCICKFRYSNRTIIYTLIKQLSGVTVQNVQCWDSYFLKVTSYILLATELFSYSYIFLILSKK